MLATFAAYAALDVRGVGAVLKVVTAGRRQGGVERARAFIHRLSQSPDLVSRQAQVANCLPELLAAVNGLQEPLPQLDW